MTRTNANFDSHVLRFSHSSTEFYQKAGYAEVTNRYADLKGAIQCLIQDCVFELPPGTQGLLL